MGADSISSEDAVELCEDAENAGVDGTSDDAEDKALEEAG